MTKAFIDHKTIYIYQGTVRFLKKLQNFESDVFESKIQFQKHFAKNLF